MSEFWFQFLYILVWPIFNLIHPGRAYGLEHIPEGGCLLCGNHTRYSDPLFILFAMGRKRHPYIMGKMELLKIPVLGWFLRRAGVIGVDRGKSDVKAIKESLRVLKEGHDLLIFPEGTRSKEGESQGAKTGAAMLALRTGVPIVPVWVPYHKKWFGRTPVVFGEAYCPQLSHEGKPVAEDYQVVADDLMARITALSEVPASCK